MRFPNADDSGTDDSGMGCAACIRCGESHAAHESCDPARVRAILERIAADTFALQWVKSLAETAIALSEDRENDGHRPDEGEGD